MPKTLRMARDWLAEEVADFPLSFVETKYPNALLLGIFGHPPKEYLFQDCPSLKSGCAQQRAGFPLVHIGTIPDIINHVDDNGYSTRMEQPSAFHFP